jgi:YD repeat-containing protein
MRHGPWQDLYGGDYTATWTLSLPEGISRPEGALCTLRITAYRGENVVAERTVQADDFDARGQLILSMPFDIKDSRNVGFEAWAQAGATVDIQRISFARTPKYDVHTFYDDRLRKTRSEYYDIDGMPTLQEDGWFACDYGYDRQGNIACVRYYGRDGAPTASADGYAERRRAYNARKKVIREEYYDAEGRPVDSARGYAAVEYDYNADGQPVKERYYDRNGALIEERTVG